ncbi:MAG: HAMP domain-containing histidine kinase [Clostridia bacterium]|nr:HAMP domain-containing histidine kinase [Clostridia bacterium]
MKTKASVYLRGSSKFKVVSITGEDKPMINEDMLGKWQHLINLTAKILNIPAALIMQITEENMQVFLKSQNPENPYESGGSDRLGHGLYCETVIGTNRELLVENALENEKWKDNPDAGLNMISYYGLPLRWPDEEVFGTICILDSKENDYERNATELIGEIKEAIEADLKFLVDYEKLERIKEKIRNIQKLESVGILAGGVAHEINNPLNGIINYSQLIKEAAAGNSDAVGYASEIISEAGRIADTISSLLAFSGNETQGVSIHMPSDIINGIISLISGMIKVNKIHLVMEIEEGLPLIETNPQLLQQVILNLVSNSMDSLNNKYIGADKDKILKIACNRAEDTGGDFIRITVEDYGLGIAESTGRHIFDPFFTTKDRTEATGLGLSISYGIVKELGGEITYESEENKWTKFHVLIPVGGIQSGA